MHLVDANVLMYAVNRDARPHAACREWLAEALGDPGRPVGFSWSVTLAFIRLSTRAGILPRPLRVDVALGVVEAWLATPAATWVHPTDRHFTLVKRLLAECGTGGNLTGDAHLAALALEHGATVVTCDQDFSRFGGLSWCNPLSAGEVRRRGR